MAILQISQITQRKGLQADLPQLAGAELGWSIDERRLWIGNGTLAEGAPVIGNTEIITEYSNIAAILNYTYSGFSAAGYVATGTVPVLYQDLFDQYASVLDFGIKGDGVTDNTAAINAALYQMYCVEPTDPAARRALFFPAGTYVVTGPILIPSNATIFGDGPQNTIIQLAVGSTGYVAQTVSSNQGAGAANTGATGITVSKMAFQNAGTDSVFLVENATNTSFNNVVFLGQLTKLAISISANTSTAVGFNITNGLKIEQVVFDECLFAGTIWGAYIDTNVTGVAFNNSEFNTLFQGVVLGPTVVANGPSGVRTTNCVFDVIYAEGVVIGNVAAPTATQLNTTGHNIFFDVGTNFFGQAFPQTPIITYNSNNNLSIGDMFTRSDSQALTQPRISVLGQDVITSQNGASFALGQYTRKSSRLATLFDSSNIVLFTQDVTNMQAFSFDYTLIRAPGVLPIVRTGEFKITSNIFGTVSWADDYTETAASGVTFSVSRVGNIVTVTYSTTATGFNGLIQYSINYFA